MVRWTTSGGGSYTEAQADSAANAEALGVVSAVADADNFTLAAGGQVTGLSGLTAGTVYFLSDATPGLLTATEPTAVGSVSKPLLVAVSTTVGYFMNMRGEILGTTPTAMLDYVEETSSHVVSGTSEGGADSFLTGSSVSVDGSTEVRIEFFAPYGAASGGTGVAVLLEDSSVIGWVAEWTAVGPLYAAVFRTPSAGSRTYSVKLWKTGGTVSVGAGSGGSGAEVPAYLRVSRA